MAYTQVERRIAISTPLGDDKLLLQAFTGAEAISEMFRFDVTLLSESDSVHFEDIVGKNVTLRLCDISGKGRYWNGFVSRFEQGSQTRRLTAYRAEVVPWLWFLTRTADCRIFQNKTVPAILTEVFEEHGFKQFEFHLYGSFKPREYCVQYRETDFNFVSRLMEEEGICYFFQHEDGKHTLILANDPVAHKACPNQPTAHYDFRGGELVYADVITEWFQEQEVRPGAWAQTDYDFENPSVNLAVSVRRDSSFEIYDFPGKHRARPDGERLARIRFEEQAVRRVVSRGSSTCRDFASGFRFSLADHYRPELNSNCLLTRVRHCATQGDYESGTDNIPEVTYSNTFECIPVDTTFRPARSTPVPVIQGCQTAVVVGPAGKEIYTDEHGRVKVQFHWDREGKHDENSSCWIRVSHPWAGQGWGSVSIPRIGQEVIVDFVEGDPDRPLIVGRVYNAEQRPPFGMPAGASSSGIKSKSTPGGGGYNEISMDDTKGQEKVTIHSQHNMSTTVENDQTTTVHNNRSSTVDVNDSETVGSNQTVKIGADQKLTVGANQNTTIGASRTTGISADDKETVGGNQKIAIGANQVISTGANLNITVGAARTVGVSGADSLTVGAGQTISVSGPISITSGASITLTAGGSSIVLGSGGITMTTGGNVTVTAAVIKHNT